MKIKLLAVALAAIVGVTSASSAASPLDHATGNPITWMDGVRFDALRGDGDPTIEVGELLLGIGQYPDFYDPLVSLTNPIAQFRASTRMLTAVSLVKVQTITVFGGGAFAQFLLGPPTPAEWMTHAGLGGIAPDTMLVLYDDPFPASGGHITANGTVAAGASSAAEGAKLLEFGLAGPGANQFWEATSVDESFNPTNLNTLDVFDFRAALNLTSGSGLTAHNYLGSLPLFPDINYAGTTHLQLSGRNIPRGGTATFPLASPTELYISRSPAQVATRADFDFDDDVDGNDLLAWQRGLGSAGTALRIDGDANSDKSVDEADFVVWQNQFATPPLATRTPEPDQCVIIGVLAIASVVGRRPLPLRRN